MFNIYEALRGGMSADELAKNFTTQLNEAEERIRQEEEAKAKEAQVAAENQAKVADFVEAIELFVEAVNKHYPDLGIAESLQETDYTEVAEMLIALLDMEAVKLRLFTAKPKATRSKREDEKNVKTADDIFAEFFKNFNF